MVGSTSVTITLAPSPRARMATPRPHQPYPATTTVQPGQQDIGGADDAVEGALARAVAIIEQMLGQRVVDRHDGVLQYAFLGHGAQADDAGGGLFGAAHDVRRQILPLGVQQRNQVRAVVHGDVRRCSAAAVRCG